MHNFPIKTMQRPAIYEQVLTESKTNYMHMYYYLSGHNLLIYLNWLVCKERRITCCHFIDQNTHCPPINGPVVSL